MAGKAVPPGRSPDKLLVPLRLLPPELMIQVRHDQMKSVLLHGLQQLQEYHGIDPAGNRDNNLRSSRKKGITPDGGEDGIDECYQATPSLDPAAPGQERRHGLGDLSVTGGIGVYRVRLELILGEDLGEHPVFQGKIQLPGKGAIKRGRL